MKNQILSLSLFSILLVSLSSCTKSWFGEEGVGPVYSQTHQIGGFDGVDLELSGNVTITQDSVYSVVVTTYDNYHSLISLNVDDGILRIDSRRSLRDDNIRIEIHLTSLQYLYLGGSGRMTTANAINGSYLKLKVAGSGKIDFAGNLSTTEAEISGSGDIFMTGSTTTGRMTISGSGTIHGFPFQCQTNRATISGSGKIETKVASSLDAAISGSGDIYYMGYPAVSTSISGSGNVIHVN